MASITALNYWLFEFNKRHKQEESRQSIEAVHSALAYVNEQLHRLSDVDSLTSTDLNYLQGNVLYLGKYATSNETILLIQKLFTNAIHKTCHNPCEEEDFRNTFSFILKGIPRKEWTQETLNKLMAFCIELDSIRDGKINAFKKFSQLFAMPSDKKHARYTWKMVFCHLLPAYYHLSEDLAKWLMLNLEFYRIQLHEFPILHSLASMPKDKQMLILWHLNCFFPKPNPNTVWATLKALITTHDELLQKWNRLSPDQQCRIKTLITNKPLKSVHVLLSLLDSDTRI